MNILLIRLKSIGDVVLTLPAVNVIRDNFPTAKITFLVSKENASLLVGFREVNEVIPIDRAAFRSANPLKVVPQIFGLLHRLRAGRFDLALDLQGYGETAWLTRLTCAPQRWGSVYGKRCQWAYTLGVVRGNMLQHAERSLAILRAGGLTVANPRNTFELPPTAQTAAQDFFRKNQIDPARPVLFIQPFTSTPGRDWPLENFLALAQHWRTQGWQVIFGGGPGDRARLEPVLAGRFITSAGVPLLVTGALMQCSTLVLGGDTGALHLAVALGRRVVMIMNSTAVESAHPFQHPNWVVTPHSGGNVPAINISDVIIACERVLAEKIPD
jgi:ADP-heptose:LPS heptosyltransferase